MLFKRLSFYLAVAGIVGTVLLVNKLRQVPAAPAPLAEPARSPYTNSVAGTGIIEASRENVKIGAPKGGLIQKVNAQIGSKVKQGDPVIQLDSREACAQLVTMEAQLEAMKASLQSEKVLLADNEDQFTRTDNLAKQNVASVDERNRKEFALRSMQARVAKIEADIKAVAAQVELAKTNIDILTVRAPRDGTILQVNVREGEYAGTTPTEPLMILGETEKLQIRADVDEQNAPLVAANQPAIAFLKGDTKNPIPLRFVRIEPYVVPKRSLTGDSAERVDTRVLQIIFEFDRPTTPLYVGQQMDVFIQRPEPTAVAKIP
ncbi:efflux RND transporter periplasmic adaptor subunit [Pedosphaera parvula]|uniref:Secretion protein HlyD family protein n=1 Tax=Pedosphaera parvula (strain Ellin514) TaxID=320771 RepID=B9XCA6_PEDPL|nr:efflux RND transporter periplasmic adaptor subunit [Pedosphaera parvula]EEF62574.1 secretion protein HlyD family protein [Pedosphaera parvula Ellin514]